MVQSYMMQAPKQCHDGSSAGLCFVPLLTVDWLAHYVSDISSRQSSALGYIYEDQPHGEHELQPVSESQILDVYDANNAKDPN